MSKELDLHDLTVEESRRLIQQEAKDPYITSIEVIHGFNSGSRLKELCSNPWNLQCKRISKCMPHPINNGRTIILLKSLGGLR